MLHQEEGESLAAYLDRHVFHREEGVRMEPDPADVAGFEAFIERYKKGLSIERAAVESEIWK